MKTNLRKTLIIAFCVLMFSTISVSASEVMSEGTCGSDMSNFVDSLIAPLSIINAIIVSLVMRNETEVARKFTELENIWDEYQVYDSGIDK